MQHQLTQTRSHHHQHSVPVDNIRYRHDNPAQVLKLQRPPLSASSSGPSLAEEVTATDATTGSKAFLPSPLHLTREATASPALGDETLSTIQEASCEPLIQTPLPHIERQVEADLLSSQRKSQTMSDRQLLLRPSHNDHERNTHFAKHDDVISKCDDATKDSETITSSEYSNQEESHALMPRATSSKCANATSINYSDLVSYTMLSPPQDLAEDDISCKNDVCKTRLESLTSVATNEMLPAGMTFDPLLSSCEQPSSIDSTSTPHSKVSNLPATVDHCCQGHPSELCVHENLLILSLDPTTGPILDQEKCEDSLTYSHETQILIPTSDAPIDPQNTREYLPTCFTPVATLSQCTHDGRWYYDEHNDFGLEIPAGAIPKGESITIDIGVALYGPFQYPEGLRPVSPVFSVCVRDQKDFQFLKPVKVTIPHCLNLECHDNIESLGLTFLKGDHEMNPQQMYQLQPAEGDVLIEPLKEYGVIETTHFCSLCIAGQVTKELVKNANFCISAVLPTTISDTESAYFFITFLLKACLTVVEEQINKDTALRRHERKNIDFQFSSDGEEKALEIVLPQSLPGKWEIGRIFKNKVCYKFCIIIFIL